MEPLSSKAQSRALELAVMVAFAFMFAAILVLTAMLV